MDQVNKVKSWKAMSSLKGGDLLRHIPHNPTGDQILASTLLLEFLAQPDCRSVFILKGYAGTGKTTVISALVSLLEQQRVKSILLAPTGRAAKVLSSISGKQAFTIHHEIYLLRTRSDGTPYLSRKPNRYKNALFIIDEASMIPGKANDEGFRSPSEKSLLEDLFSFARNGVDCKLIFVGDHAQLPPVGLLQSPALDSDYLNSVFGLNSFVSELKTVVRQSSESGILANATFLRQKIGQQSYLLPMFQLGFKDVKRISSSDLEEELLSTLGQDPETTVLVTRSNRRANKYNQEIRRRVLGKDGELSAGDLLMVVRNNYYWLDDKDDMGFIANGDVIRIERINNYEDRYGFRFADARISFVDYPHHEGLQVKLCLDPIDADAPSLTLEEHKTLFGRVLEDYFELSSRQARTEAVRNNPYYNALQVKFAYALTCHKTQGGQWQNVFVEQGFIREEMLDEDLYRWMYTAVTRATGTLYLINFRDEFFSRE